MSVPYWHMNECTALTTSDNNNINNFKSDILSCDYYKSLWVFGFLDISQVYLADTLALCVSVTGGLQRRERNSYVVTD